MFPCSLRAHNASATTSASRTRKWSSSWPGKRSDFGPRYRFSEGCRAPISSTFFFPAVAKRAGRSLRPRVDESVCPQDGRVLHRKRGKVSEYTFELRPRPATPPALFGDGEDLADAYDRREGDRRRIAQIKRIVSPACPRGLPSKSQKACSYPARSVASSAVISPVRPAIPRWAHPQARYPKAPWDRHGVGR